MYKYPSVKTKKVWFTVLCVFFAIMLSACGTKKPVVPNTDTVISKAGPGTPKVSNEPIKPLIDMVFVQGGTFKMGSAPRPRKEYPNQEVEWPRHDVTLNDFSIGKYEVTQGEYYEVTGLKPSNALTNPDDKSPDGWKKLPVESITWYDALLFCNMLSIKEKLRPVYSINGSFDPDDWGEPPAPFKKSAVWDTAVMDVKAEGYRLPTEAEWEYAARGGQESKGYEYAGAAKENAAKVAWFSVIINKTPVGAIHEVGKKQPNELGLYDMSGNVMEWCWDWFGDYPKDAQVNPLGPSKGLYRVIRGGGWSVRDFYSRVLYRHNNQAQYIGVNLGFRVVRNN